MICCCWGNSPFKHRHHDDGKREMLASGVRDPRCAIAYMAGDAGMCGERVPCRRGTAGGLHLRRRAPKLFHELTSRPEAGLHDPFTAMDWVNLYAMAVNEENAAGHRVVTAPTNGAAGIIPAVLHYYTRIHGHATEDDIIHFLLTAGAIGLLYKMNALHLRG